MDEGTVLQAAKLLNWYMIQKEDEIRSPDVTVDMVWDALCPESQEHLLAKARGFLNDLNKEE